MSTAPASKTAVPHQRVGWVELFYDLVFVVVIEKLTHLVHEDPSLGIIFTTIGLCAVAWFCWFNVTSLTNLLGGVPVKGRPLLFASMAGVGVMALGVEGAAHGRPWLFVIGVTLARSAPWPLMWLWFRRNEEPVGRALVNGPLLSLGWLLTPLLPHHYGWGFALLVVADMSTSILRPEGADRKEPVVNGPHMIERIGLFLMIVLGESVVQIITALDTDRTAMHWFTATLAMTLLCALWWLVYDASMAKLEDLTEHSEANALDFVGGSQFGISAGLVLVAGGLSAAIHSSHPEEGSAHLHHGSLVALCLGILMVAFGVSSLSRRAFALSFGLTPAQRAADAERAERRQKGGTKHLLAWATHSFTGIAPVIVVFIFGGHWAPWLVLTVLAFFVCLSIVGPARREAQIATFLSEGRSLEDLQQTGRERRRGRRAE